MCLFGELLFMVGGDFGLRDGNDFTVGDIVNHFEKSFFNVAENEDRLDIIFSLQLDVSAVFNDLGQNPVGYGN